MAQVQVLQPYNAFNDVKETVAAYCRVSTDSSDQLNSYRSQISYYTNFITSNPNWELADIYADEGITGTSIDKRDEFQRLLQDCRAGKIKRVLVKSVSRFARNTIELIETTRELKQLGVVVVFEEQGIDTSQMLGEMHLTMFAIAAQEESYSISKNMRWSYQKRMESGTFKTCYAPYGYMLEQRKLTPHPEESKVISYMAYLASKGMGRYKIAQQLNDLGIPPRNGKEKWLGSTVDYILKNEKNIGDCLLQKEYTPETLPFRKIRNHGEVPQFYISEDHEAIIDRQLYQNLRELAEQRGKSYSRHVDHLFTHRILCPDCNKHFRHVESYRKSYWLCPNRVNNLSTCPPFRFSEEDIKAAYLNMVGKLYLYHDKIFSPMLSLLQEIEIKQTGEDKKLYEINQALMELNDKMLVLQKLNTKGYIDSQEYHRKNSELTIERKNLAVKKTKQLNGHKATELMEKITALQVQIESWSQVPIDFSIELFDSLVFKIIPTGKNELLFRLHCGVDLAEAIPS